MDPNGSFTREVRAWIIFGSSSCEVAGEEPCLYPTEHWNSLSYWFHKVVPRG